MSTGSDAKVIVSADHLKAWVRLRVPQTSESVPRSLLLAAIEDARIAITPAVQTRLDELCQLLESESSPAGDLPLAEASPPTEPVDAVFEWDPSLRPGADSQNDQASRISHYDRNIIVSASAGQTVGRIVPAVEGQPGVDVHGQTIPPSRKALQITLGSNVSPASDGQSVVAACDGRVMLEDHKLSIASVLQVPGDVDFGTGNIDATGDVTVAGSVKDLFHVRTSKDIEVGQHVDGAQLEAGGDIIIRGGVHGRGKANIRASGRVVARICDSATIEAGHLFSVQKECINCCVRAGRIAAPAGTIIGGYVWARHGVEVLNLGSPACTRTFVAVGVPSSVMEEATQSMVLAKERLESAGLIREKIAPLLREMRRLSPQQRERATELMFEADQLEQEAKTLDQKREAMIRQAAPEGDAGVQFTGRLYPGTTIIISGRSTTVDVEMCGPGRIVERKIDNLTTLVLVNMASGHTHPLATGRFSAEAEARAQKAAEAALSSPIAAAVTAS